MTRFPRTEVAGISLPRLLMGTNWVLGYSHTSASADAMIRHRFAGREAVADLVEAYLAYDIDAMMAPFASNQVLLDGIHMAEDRTGKKVTLIDTPIIDVSDSAQGRQAAMEQIARGRAAGAAFCLIHHSSAEKLVSKLHGTIDRLPDYLDMIRQQGMIPGLSAHMPELILYSDQNNYDVQTYIQLFNCAGFLMQVEVEYIHKVIWQAKKPVMTIKAMAAGRVSPFVGLTFSFATLRPCDMVTLGAHTPAEVHEDVEIALAAIERRPPQIGGRSSPNKAAIPGADTYSQAH
ncbi:MAG: hypothetical protein GX112_07680 [Clostridiaceae bacterium]|jgi:hypothetical protein|nr:hypothetical protein [Clostridiaceae bacterium]